MWSLRRFLAKRRYRFSVLEHRFSRLVPVLILVGLVLEMAGQRNASLLWLGASLAIWLLYWISHSLEKIAFKMGRG